jgi:hypothetical protein
MPQIAPNRSRRPEVLGLLAHRQCTQKSDLNVDSALQGLRERQSRPMCERKPRVFSMLIWAHIPKGHHSVDVQMGGLVFLYSARDSVVWFGEVMTASEQSL